MKTSFLNKFYIALSICLVSFSCQDLDHPKLGEYPKDEVNIPDGNLRFFVPFDSNSESLRYKFQEELSKYPTFELPNSITEDQGINGKSFKSGLNKTYLQYVSANDFAAKTSSFTVAFWAKHASPTQTEFAFSLISNNWAKSSFFALFEGSQEKPTIKFYIDQQPVDKWFDWENEPLLKDIYQDKWVHLAFVYDETTSGLSLYLDAKLVSTKFWENHGKIKLNPSLISYFRIGGPGNISEGWMNSWTGNLDQFRMYVSALNQTEINDLYVNKK